LGIWWYANGNKRFEVPYKKGIEHGITIDFNY